jgi:aminoglycoside phosphotransferase (APT) family kinase protein
MPDDRIEIGAEDVARLIAEQFPHWSHLPVVPVELSGWDNRTFRLGSDMSVRLPSAAGYVAQVEKEHRWLPQLAPHLPLPIPSPLAMGQPSDAYPFPWSIYRWIDGEPAAIAPISDLSEFAKTLASFLAALQAIDAGDGPAAGEHNFFRGGPVVTYDSEARRAIEALAGEIGADLATEVWETALASSWQDRPVWVHGDVASGNLLVAKGGLPPSSISARPASATPPATSTSPGPSSKAKAGRPFAQRCRSTPRHGSAAAAGRCGKRSSSSPSIAAPRRSAAGRDG